MVETLVVNHSRWSAVVNLLATLVLAVATGAILVHWSRSSSNDAATLQRLTPELLDEVPIHIGYSVGSPSAPIVVAIYEDFGCVSSRRFHTELLPEIEQTLVSAGQVRLSFLPLPLEGRGDRPLQEAALAVCAGPLGVAREARDELFRSPQTRIDEVASRMASLSPASRGTLALCLEQTMPTIAAYGAEAKRLGIRGTPTFLFGVEPITGVLKTLLVQEGMSRESNWFRKLTERAQERARSLR